MSAATTGVSAIVVGLALTIVAGLLNGSWNAAFNPKVALAVGPKSTVETVQLRRQRTVLKRLTASFSSHLKSDREYDLDYHYAWVLFQIYAAIINSVVCLTWAGGPSNVYFVVSQASTTSIALVIVFSLVWGVGSVLFGLACKISGVGLGTNLTMSVVLMIGTFLPLVYYGGIKSATGVIIIAGIAIVCVGLYFSASSLRVRDLDFTKANQHQMAAASSSPVDSYADEESKRSNIGFNEVGESDKSKLSNRIGLNEADETDKSKLSNSMSSEDARRKNEQDAPEFSMLVKISICLLAGVLASQLQFAFIFGQELIDIAENDGVTPLGGSAAIIWLFAITIGCIPSIIFGFTSSPKETPLKSIWLCPWWRHPLLISTTSLPWIGHIHLYGLAANLLLPKKIAASIAWPTIMTTTVAQGMLLSICLGEWKGASSEALSKLRIGLCLSVTGVIMFMASVAL